MCNRSIGPGDYTQINCSACGRLLWFDTADDRAVAEWSTDALRARGLDRSPDEVGRLLLLACAHEESDPARLIESLQRRDIAFRLDDAMVSTLLSHPDRSVRQRILTQLREIRGTEGSRARPRTR